VQRTISSLRNGGTSARCRVALLQDGSDSRQWRVPLVLRQAIVPRRHAPPETSTDQWDRVDFHIEESVLSTLNILRAVGRLSEDELNPWIDRSIDLEVASARNIDTNIARDVTLRYDTFLWRPFGVVE
jgi:hypothetical protein